MLEILKSKILCDVMHANFSMISGISTSLFYIEKKLSSILIFTNLFYCDYLRHIFLACFQRGILFFFALLGQITSNGPVKILFWNSCFLGHIHLERLSSSNGYELDLVFSQINSRLVIACVTGLWASVQ